MNKIKKLYCRTFQTVFRIAIPILPYRSPRLLHSVDELPALLNEQNISSVLLVTDAGIRSLGLTTHLEELFSRNEISLTVYDGTVANPTTDNVAEALALYKENNCQVLIGFGGGSSMDCAKAVGACVARLADAEANPLYPVPVLMNAKELEQFYNAVMKQTTK